MLKCRQIGRIRALVALTSLFASALVATVGGSASATVPSVPKPPGIRIEAELAENGDDLSLDTTHCAPAGCSGSAYLTGLVKQSTAASFLALGPRTATTFVLTFRYSAGSGEATSVLKIAGANGPTVTFPATADWDTWSIVTVETRLPPRTASIDLYGDGTNSINLDYLDIAPKPEPIVVLPPVDPPPTTTPPPPPVTTNRFVPLPPQRILDTRSAIGAATTSPIAPKGDVTLTVAGHGGVPTTGATAVVMNVTVTNATGIGYITVYPADVSTMPIVSNLNLTQAGQTVANLVTVRLSADGKVKIFTSGGGHVLADVAGYYTTAATATSGRFVPIGPVRFFDSRGRNDFPMKAGETATLAALGATPLPTSGISALILNVTLTDSLGDGFLTVWPSGLTQPDVSNLNVIGVRQNVANQVIVPVGTDGKVSFFASRGGGLIIDLAGYFTDSTAPESGTGLFTPVVPGRIVDTRPDDANRLGTTKQTFAMSNTASHIPATGVKAVVMNLTAADTGGAGFVTAWPANLPAPTVSVLNWGTAGATVPNHAIVSLSPTGEVSFATLTSTHLIADSAGWFN
jgi:hypothetical protein